VAGVVGAGVVVVVAAAAAEKRANDSQT